MQYVKQIKCRKIYFSQRANDSPSLQSVSWPKHWSEIWREAKFVGDYTTRNVLNWYFFMDPERRCNANPTTMEFEIRTLRCRMLLNIFPGVLTILDACWQQQIDLKF